MKKKKRTSKIKPKRVMKKYKKHRFRNHIPNPKGAPRKEINWVEFEKLCGIQSTLMEMCSWFDCDDVTLEKRVLEHYGMQFQEVYKRKRGKGKVSLRRRQFQSALEGDTRMLIFLGQQYLEQADKKEVKSLIKNVYETMTDEQLAIEDEKLSKLLQIHKVQKETNALRLLEAREVQEVDGSPTESPIKQSIG